MLNLKQRFGYFASSAMNYFSTATCPSCGSHQMLVIDRKMIVTRLMKCKDCQLMFRHPTDSLIENSRFYQTDYFEKDGLTTEMPSASDVSGAIDSNSNAARRSLSRYSELFSLLVEDLKGVKVVDYGASWGYLSYQFKRLEMDVESYEISLPRASFGNQKLGLNIKTSESELRRNNQLFFSSHVIEHVPSVSQMLRTAETLIDKNGLIVILCPNGSQQFRERDPKGFHKCWGKVHPNYLGAEYFRQYYAGQSHFIATHTEDWPQLSKWNRQTKLVCPRLDGDELLVVVNKS